MRQAPPLPPPCIKSKVPMPTMRVPAFSVVRCYCFKLVAAVTNLLFFLCSPGWLLSPPSQRRGRGEGGKSNLQGGERCPPPSPAITSRHGGMPRLRAGAQHLRDEDAGGVPGEGMWGRAVDRDYSEGLPPAPPPGEKETVRRRVPTCPAREKLGEGYGGA